MAIGRTHDSMPLRSQRRPRTNCWLPIAIAIAAVVIGYLPSFSGGFILDDPALIENNPTIRSPQSLQAYFTQEDGVLDDAGHTDDYHTGYYRPLINITYRIDYLLHGMDSTGFRTSNILLHALTAATLMLVLNGIGGTPAAILVGLIFALHPVHTETVNIVAARNNMLSTLFGLWCLAGWHCYLQDHRLRGLIAAVCCFGLSLMSKEYGAMLLPILFLWEQLHSERSAVGVWHRPWGRYVPFVIVLMIYLGARMWVIGRLAPSAHGDPLAFRLAMAPFLILFNLRLLLIPMGLHSFIIDYPSSPWRMPFISGILGVCLIGWLIWRYRGNRLILFGAGAWLLGLFPVLNIIPTSAVSLVSMRWLYFPTAFLCFGAVPLMEGLLRRYHMIALTAAVAVVVLLGSVTFALNQYHWNSPWHFFHSELTRFDNRFYAGGYAEVLQGRGEMQKAEHFYRIAMKQKSRKPEDVVNFAGLLAQTGRAARAIQLLETLDPHHIQREQRAGWYNNQGMALIRMGRVDEAVTALEQAVAVAPDSPGMLANLGSALGRAGQYDRSERVLRKALRLAPDSVMVIQNLVTTLLRLNATDEARQLIQRLPLHVVAQHPEWRTLLNRSDAEAPAAVSGRTTTPAGRD